MVMPLTIKVKVQKVGNSLMMTLPKDVIEDVKWDKGDTLVISLDGLKMIVQKKEEK